MYKLKCHQDNFCTLKKSNSRDIIRIFREILRNLRKFSQVNAKLIKSCAQNAIIKTRNGNINSVSRAMNENKCVPFQCVVFLCYNFYFYFFFQNSFQKRTAVCTSFQRQFYINDPFYHIKISS